MTQENQHPEVVQMESLTDVMGDLNPLTIDNGPQIESVSESLIGDDSEPFTEFEGDVIAVSDIKMSPYQARRFFNQDSLEELTESIKQSGLIQSIPVIKDGDKYTLIAGERRFRAWQMAHPQATKIPARCLTVVESELTGVDLFVMGLSENIVREDLSYLELSEAIAKLKTETNWTHIEIAYKVFGNKTEGNEESSKQIISQYLQISELPDTVKQKLIELVESPPENNDGKKYQFTKTYALLLTRLKDEGLQIETIQTACKNEYTKKQLTDHIEFVLNGDKKKKTPAKTPRMIKYEKSIGQQISEQFGTKATLDIKEMQGSKIVSANIKLEVTEDNNLIEKLSVLAESFTNKVDDENSKESEEGWTELTGSEDTP
ncbi:MAG: ParB/RepB/Spo0J family partition protein [Pseudomonadota bacterium]|nr:ParB/RepB/Spo0J family partition protein [Pseudomonadota bacterium]